jgi:hypothetical protein
LHEDGLPDAHRRWHRATREKATAVGKAA